MTSVGCILLPDGDSRPFSNGNVEDGSPSTTGGRYRRSESSQDLLKTQAYLTPEQVAQVLQLDLSTVYRKLRNGQIPGTKEFGKWLVSTHELVELMATRTKEGCGVMSSPVLGGRPSKRTGRLGGILVERDES